MLVLLKLQHLLAENKIQLEDFRVAFSNEVSCTSRHPAVAGTSSTTITMFYDKITGM